MTADNAGNSVVTTASGALEWLTTGLELALRTGDPGGSATLIREAQIPRA
jgi:hypothetical protein